MSIDALELFSDCLAQATIIVKQVLPNYLTNPTPEAEWDVRDLTEHMISVLNSVPAVLLGKSTETNELENFEDALEHSTEELSYRWQQAADEAEAAILEVDLDDTVIYNSIQLSIEDFLIEQAGDLLIHAWDLGEAIGMPVKFAPNVAAAVMETTLVPNKTTLREHNLLMEPLDSPLNADLQARLLALFGRSNSWREHLAA